MSNTPFQEPPAQGASFGSVQTLASRPLQPVSDPSASRRVCFYKSGDLKFSGHRMVINARTFKTFDALLDALSKKVPLPFGVRTVTTPRGLHPVKRLEDLHDGGSYVCSDRKRVKPLNLNAVQRRQVPWNTTRPVSAGRRERRGPPRIEGIIRPAKVIDRVAVRTPKRLVVIKNRDPTIKHTVVLQRRTAPTFDALLDYLSQIMHFPVLKLFSADGRRVDGLAGLILCSGVIVAAGNEPFKLGKYSFHRSGQNVPSVYSDVMEASRLQPLTHKKKSFSSGRGSRNFSLSSERYIVNQINKSLNGSTNNHRHHNTGSFETELNLNNTSTDTETCEDGRQEDRCPTCIIPQDEDIEKSFRVNQDGSMTVEMKVRLTIKEEEMLQWTTTLSRTSLNQRTGCASKSGSGKSSPDSNNAMAKDASGISEDESKEENHPAVSRERGHKSYSPRALEKPKTCFKRTPTPGPRRAKKTASVESITTMTESGFQESTLGQYSYVERTTDMTEGYCLVRHSNRPVPKPRKTASAGAGNKGSHSSVRSAGVAEVLQIENNGMEITETVMHIYERQGCYDNYFANNEYSTDELPGHGSSPIPQDKPASTGSGPRSSSNDCDIDFTQQPFTADSLHRRKEEILSLSSEPISPTPEISNNLSAITSNTQTQSAHQEAESITKDNTVPHEKKKKVNKPAGKRRSSPSITPDKNQKDSMANSSKTAKHASADKLSNVTGKRSGSSSESGKNGPKGKEGETLQTKKKVNKDDTAPSKKQALSLSSENVKGTSSKKQVKVNPRAPRDNGHNVNTPETKTTRPPMKKNMLDILQPKQSSLPGKKGVTQQKSMSEKRISSPNQTLELNESISMPTLNHTPSDIHQYVENWLQKISPDSVPYMEETATAESQPRTKVVFQIGGDSESEAKSECQADADGCHPSHGDAVAKSMSCLSVPVCGGGLSADVQNNVQKAKGLCASMPSVRIDPIDRESRLRTHKSAEAIGPIEDESSAFTSNLLSPKGRIKPVLQQLCSSIQCIRRASDPKSSNLEKSNSLPDFSSQVASVFGSSSKAFLSFLSVMTLRETLTGSVAEDSYDSRNTSEAMLMMESLQKISTIQDEEEQRASLTDLQSRTSSQLIERWRDFQVLRERLESEPLSPKFSEQEFALDVVSEGDAFDDQHLGIDELMEELNMPQDLRQEIASTLQQTKSFYPEVEESTYVEKEMHHSDSEEELEQFVKETKQSPEPDPSCIAENIDKTSVTEDTDNGYKLAGETDDSSKTQFLYHEQTNILSESEQKQDEDQEIDPDVKQSEAEEQAETLNNLENNSETGLGKNREEEEEEGEGKMEDGEKEEYVGKVEEHRVEETQEEDEDTKEVEEMGEETETRAEEWEEEAEEERKKGGEVEEGEEEPEEEGEERTGEAMLVGEEEEEELEEGDKEIEEKEEIGGEGLADEEMEWKEEVVEENDEEGDEEVVDRKSEREEVEEESIEESEEEGEEEIFEKNERERVEEVIEEKDEEDEGEENVNEEEDEEDEGEENVIEEDEKEEVEENVNDEEDEKEEMGENVNEEDEKEEVEENVIEEDEKEEVEENVNDEEDEKEEVEENVIEEDEKEEVEENVNDEEDEKEEVEENVNDEEDEKEEVEENVIEEDEKEEVEENVNDEEDEKEEVEENVNDEEDEKEEVEENVIEEDEKEEVEENVNDEEDEKEEVEENVNDEEDEKEEVEENVIEEDEKEEVEENVNDEEDEKEEVEENVNDEEDEKEEVEANVNDEEDEEEEVWEEAIKEKVEEDEAELEEVVEEEEDKEEEQEKGESEGDRVEEDGEIEEREEEEDEVAEDQMTEEKLEVGEEEAREIIEEEGEGEADEEEREENSEEEEARAEEQEEGEDVTNKEDEVDMDAEQEVEGEEGSGEEEEEQADDLDGECEQVEERETRDEEDEEERCFGEPVIANAESIASSNAGKIVLEEAYYLQQHSSSEEEVNADTKGTEHDLESPNKSLTESQCEDDKGHGTDTANEFKTDDGEEEYEDRSSSLPHPVEISQQLLDFVNSALQSSSLTFTYDARGNIRIGPDNAQVVQTNQIIIPKSREDSLYGLKRLPSPNTSDLSDYRPETSESGGYKTQESVDITSESGEEPSERQSPDRSRTKHMTDLPNGILIGQQVNSNLPFRSKSEHLQSPILKSGGSLSSYDSGTKALREDLSYFSAASSLKADAELAAERSQCISSPSEVDSNDGVLIEQGRWLLKENHLIRKSPPIPVGMYGNVDTTSVDTCQENTSLDSLPNYLNQRNPLAVISSSELEEMAKPQTPKCTYYNMSHGSDSDPFLDDVSVKSGKTDASSSKRKGLRVSPTTDTSKTRPKKNGSLSSFASVEFKMPDSKVHPEGEPSAVMQARRPPGVAARVLRAQDSLDTLHVRCGQYCPIL